MCPMDTTLSPEPLCVLTARNAPSWGCLLSPGPRRNALGCLCPVHAQGPLGTAQISSYHHGSFRACHRSPSHTHLSNAIPNPHSVVSHRRTVGKNTGLSCPFAGSCKINKAQRRHCPACRLRKCLDAGMKKESESPPHPSRDWPVPSCPTQQAQEAFPTSWVMSP